MHAHKTKRITRLFCSALALLCVVTFVAGELTPSALAVTQSQIDDL